MTFSSLAGTVTGTSSQAVNLINYALTFDSFPGSEFIIFNDSDYSYYIVWGDLKREGERVISSGEVEYVHYYRTSSSGYSNYYTYEVGRDVSFVVNLSTEYICTTSIEGSGFVSSTYVQHEFYHNAGILFIFAVSMLFAMMIKSFRRDG